MKTEELTSVITEKIQNKQKIRAAIIPSTRQSENAINILKPAKPNYLFRLL
jgi:hypothetical protein